MNPPGRSFIWVFAALLLIVFSFASCSGSTDDHVFSLREGIAQFSLQYPAAYSVTRIDIRNSPTERYTDVGLDAGGANSLKEISVYAWPAGDADGNASLILNGVLARAGTVFKDFNVLERTSAMVGDMDGQVARFSWTALPAGSDNATLAPTLPAVSRIVCFRHNDIAWEIDVASDVAGQAAAAQEFQDIIDTFQVLN